MTICEATAGEIEALKDIMYEEAREAKYYADLARSRCSYYCSTSLKQLSDEEATHLKRLQAEYYILTGATFFPCVAMLDIPSSYLEALRERFIKENEAAKTYLEAAAQSSSPRLSVIYNELSEDELRHGENVASLISDYICSI